MDVLWATRFQPESEWMGCICSYSICEFMLDSWICSFLLEDLCFWNYTITNFFTLLTAVEWYVCRSYQLQSGHWLVGCIKWNNLCEFRLDSCTLLILTWTCVGFGITALLTLLLGSLLQDSMFYKVTNFNQDISGWDVSSGTRFVSLCLILVHCSFLLEHVWVFELQHY